MRGVRAIIMRECQGQNLGSDMLRLVFEHSPSLQVGQVDPERSRGCCLVRTSGKALHFGCELLGLQAVLHYVWDAHEVLSVVVAASQVQPEREPREKVLQLVCVSGIKVRMQQTMLLRAYRCRLATGPKIGSWASTPPKASTFPLVTPPISSLAHSRPITHTTP